MSRRLIPIVASVVCLVLPAAAQNAKPSLLLRKPFTVIGQKAVIPNCPGSGEELQPPTTLQANAQHVLSTTLNVTSQSMQVPVYVKSNGVWTCSMKTFDLRLYNDPETGQPKYPGPTLLVTREMPGYTPGDRINVLLKNNLPPSNEECVWSQGNCDCSNPNNLPQCCKDTTKPNGMNCFHGDNTTNLHFHGTHVSPQSPQDFVLLQLTPAGTAPGSVMHGKDYEASGQFQYAVDPLPANQSEGTHWYHPHKHGSTAEQVGNGMAGAIIIKGPFDAWLQSQFNNQLREKLLVVQQVHDLNFNTLTGRFTPLPLINGQLVPQITMYKGEIQRWRIVNANIDASAQFVIDFNGVVDNNVQAKQIAMDGVQFSPKNYQCQPLLNGTCDGGTTDLTFQFSPGNRADFLVKAPPSVGEFFVSYEVFGNVEEQGTRPTQETASARRLPVVQRALTRQTLDAVAPGTTQPALFSINVIDCPAGMNCDMQFPQTLPDLPPFLRPITPKGDPQTVQFQVLTADGKPKANPAPAGVFGIMVKGQNGDKAQQFNDQCAAFTEVLDPDGGEEWHISQNLASGAPFHVFHIHTNPFQVVSTFNAAGQQIVYPEPIWQDSITLPSNQKFANPPTSATDTEVVIRQRFEDYTGLYVLHCHFLGHEDRGMMLSVQTVCPNKTDSWSATSATQKECTFGQFLPAAPPCSSLAASSAHRH